MMSDTPASKPAETTHATTVIIACTIRVGSVILWCGYYNSWL